MFWFKSFTLTHKSRNMPMLDPGGILQRICMLLFGCTVAPGQTILISTGIAMGFPADYGALIEDRSGMAVRGLTTLAGVIDPGYRGEIKVVLINLAAISQAVAAGDRVAQLRLVRRIEATFEVVDSLDETVRAVGGFGSTGA